VQKFVRFRPFSALACGLVALAAGAIGSTASAQEAPSGEMKPVAIIAATNYDEILADVDYLGQFGGQVKAGQQLNNMLMLFTQNKGLEGLDKSKPWGAIVQTDGFQFVPLVCLPVTDLQPLLGLMEVFGMSTSDAGDGVTEIEIPNQSLFVKQSGNWAYVAQAAEMLENLPADPGATFAKMTTDHDVAVTVMVENVPEMYRSIAIEQLRAGAEQELQQKEDETDEAFAARKEMTEASIEQIAQFINELDEMFIGFNTDTEGGNVLLDLAYSAQPGTELAKGIDVYKSASTQFAGFLKDGAAMQFNLSVTSPPELLEKYRKQTEGQLKSLRQQMMTAIDQEADLPNDEARETVKAAANDLMDVFEATALGGKMDTAGYANFADGKAVAVAGGYAKDTAKVEAALKKLAALVEDDPEFPGVKWNADKHGGAAIHTMAIPVPDHEEEARELFGETLDVAVGLASDKLYVAAGADCVSAMKQAIDASGSSPSAVKPMQVSFALTPILKLAVATDPKPESEAMLEALTTKGAGMDSAHLTVETVDGQLRTRIEIEKGVLEAIGAAAMEARRQGAAAGF
jgi:hypothetical protein